jgi:hypothetical protein
MVSFSASATRRLVDRFGARKVILFATVVLALPDGCFAVALNLRNQNSFFTLIANARRYSIISCVDAKLSAICAVSKKKTA